jgi:uncharacterized protein involved in exopolysaccharide biosynthesis
MRLKFWQSAAPTPTSSSAPAPKPAPALAVAPAPAPQLGDLDLGAIRRALFRNKHWIVLPTVAAAALSFVAVNMMTPRYKSEARILVDGRENIFMRANADRAMEERSGLDPEAVTSQVQLVLSRDLAREIIKRNKLAERPEFDPVLQGLSPVRALLAAVGIGRDPFKMTPEERVLDAYYERLQAYAVDKSRVIAIEFQSRDPDLAARVANSIAEGYMQMQQSAKQDQARSAGQWLSGEIDNLRKKVADAESRVEEFRGKASLFIGNNNTSLSNQQLGDITTQLSNARAQKSDAESKARLIREMLQSGRPIEASDVLNSELVRRLGEQRVTLRAQLAEQSSTLLDGHPRIKELRAQINDLDRQIREEASKLSRSFENDARMAGARAESMGAALEQLKKQASSTNGQDVQLRALEREAKAQRDLLESYLAKYREATTRESLESGPSDGRIISRAIVTNTPAFPKKVPIVVIATLATLLLTTGIIVTGELLRMTGPAQSVVAAPMVKPSVYPAMRSSAAVAASDVDRLAAALRAAGENARKIAVMGTGDESVSSSTALALARAMARQSSVVLIDLAAAPATAAANPNLPGLSELVQGTASFGQIIGRDTMSRLQTIGPGKMRDPAVLRSPRLALAVDALTRVYEHVVLDAGSLDDVPEALISSNAHAVLVASAPLDERTQAVIRQELMAAGFRGVSVIAASAVTLEDADLRMAAA